MHNRLSSLKAKAIVIEFLEDKASKYYYSEELERSSVPDEGSLSEALFVPSSAVFDYMVEFPEYYCLTNWDEEDEEFQLLTEVGLEYTDNKFKFMYMGACIGVDSDISSIEIVLEKGTCIMDYMAKIQRSLELPSSLDQSSQQLVSVTDSPDLYDIMDILPME